MDNSTLHLIEQSDEFHLGSRTRKLAQLLFIFICVETIFSIPYRSVYLATHSRKQSWTAAIFACILAAIAFRFRSPILSVVRGLFESKWIGSKRWLRLWLAVGLILRLAWVLLFPVTLKSDGLVYFYGAESLAAHHYPGAGWPMGLPLFLAPFFMVFGSHEWVTSLCALLLFIGTYLVGYRLAKDLCNEAAAGLTGMILAIWPGYLTTTGVNQKEVLLALILPAAMLLYLRSAQKPTMRWRFAVLAGVLLGFAALTQPGILLFPAVIYFYEWLREKRFWLAVGRMAVFSLAMLIAILPWTLCNYLEMHRVVLISMNGGSVFYRANNPLANASYSPEGEIPLPANKVAADREGYKAGGQWIVHHPLSFAVLATRKQVAYLGDDGIGIYETFKRDLQPSTKWYAAAKALCSVFWLALWSLLLLASLRLFKMRQWKDWYGLCFLPLVYQWIIDSVFESGSRHHIAYVAFVAVLVGIVLNSTGQEPVFKKDVIKAKS